MKLKAGLVNGFIIAILGLLMGGVGFYIGNSTIGEYNPPWKNYPIQMAPAEAVNIVHIDIRSTVDDPTGDILYVKTKNGEVYASTLFQNDWRSINPLPAWDNISNTTECAPEWPGPTNAHMWDPPPVEKGIKDSAGIRFERPVSIIARCYVLSDDGSLEVWVHSGNAMDLSAGELLKLVYPCFGTIIGIVMGAIIIHFRRRAVSPTA